MERWNDRFGTPVSVRIDRELHEIVVGVAEVDAGRHAARARARAGPGLDGHAGAGEQVEHLLHAAVPDEAEVGATHAGPASAKIAGARGPVASMDVDLLRSTDADGRHRRAPLARLLADLEAEPAIERERALDVADDHDPVIDGRDAHDG